jgi:hypothetical protein
MSDDRTHLIVEPTGPVKFGKFRNVQEGVVVDLPKNAIHCFPSMKKYFSENNDFS